MKCSYVVIISGIYCYYYHPQNRIDFLDAPNNEMVHSVAILSCVDIFQGDGEDVTLVIRPENR